MTIREVAQNLGVRGALVFVPSQNGSHNPAEFATTSDLAATAELTTAVMEQLAI